MVGLKVEKINIKSLVPADYNPRKISGKDYNNLKQSIDKFGIVDPIIINLKDNTIIGGHQRFDVLFYDKKVEELNLIRLGDVGWVFPDTNLKIKDKNHEKTLNLALNRVHGEWDLDKVNEVLIDLEELNLAHLTGFDLELDDIDYDFISRDDEFVFDEDSEEEYNDDDYYEEEYEEESYDIEEEYEENKIEEEKIEDKSEPVEDRIRRGFIKYGDIYRVGDSSYLMFGKETNEQDRTKLLNIIRPRPKINLDSNFKKIKTVNKEINYYMSDDAELIEKYIIENNSKCEKIR